MPTFPRIHALILALAFILAPLSAFAAINASQTMVLQTGGTERARLNTEGIIATRVSATYISVTYIEVPTPTGNNQPATKSYVDTAVAAAAASRPTYMGITSATYAGTLGGGTLTGVTRGNMLCAANYAGSRMLLSSDIPRTNFSTPIASSGWFHCDVNTYDSGARCAAYAFFQPGTNCNTSNIDWNAPSSEYGLILLSTHAVSRVLCNVTYPIHCVKD